MKASGKVGGGKAKVANLASFVADRRPPSPNDRSSATTQG